MAIVSSSRIRALAIVVTVLVLVAHYVLPPRHIPLHPYSINAYTIYSDGEWGGESSVAWIDKQSTQWQCNLVRSPAHPVCGLSIHWNDTERGSIDAGGYKSLKIKLRYSGAGNMLRLYMRNFDIEHGILDDRDTHKFMYVNLPTSDLGSFEESYETTIALSELQVADWWKEEYKIDRNNAQPEFNSITSIGIDFPFPPAHVYGEHSLELISAELVGDWISAERLYLGIILTWLAALFFENLFNMYRWRKLARENLRQVQDLTDYAKELRVKSEKYRELSHIDSLTEVYNRYGFMQTLKQLFGRGALNGCLLIVDLDHFKAINDSFGHIVGDRVLRDVARLCSGNIRKSDVFARWGGEEFVLLVTGYELAQAQALAEKLRLLIEGQNFSETDKIEVTISIGLTSFAKKDSLNSAFIRADEALYMAKKRGRNQVVATASDSR